jgi:hypothetical protein
MSEAAHANLSEEEKTAVTESAFESPLITMHDARALQATYESPGAFYKAHGFCLLQHKTNVKEWNIDYGNSDNDITKIYHAEIDALLKN